MPRPRNSSPTYTIHKQSGRGRLVWYDSTGLRQQKLLPGPFGSPESLAAKARLELELATSPTPAQVDSKTLTVAEVLIAYLDFAEQHYRDQEGNPTDEVRHLKPGAQLFIDAWNAWQPWLPPPTPPTPPTTLPPAYHVYLKPLIHQAVIRWRNSLNVPLPQQHQLNTTCPVVAPGVTHDAIETDERCAPGDWIVDRLVDGKRAHLQKVRQLSRLTLAHDATLGKLRIQSVEVVMNDGTIAVFEPKTLLLCAGVANQSLLDSSIWGVPRGHTLPAAFGLWNQTHRETVLDMIVASGPTGTLPVFNGSVAGGLVRDKTNQLWNIRAFVVSRTDLDGNTVWIASGLVDRTDSANPKPLEYMTGRDFRWMLVNFLSGLFSFNPAHPQLIWGVYSGGLTTWRRKPDVLSSRTFVNMGIEGLLVCYTDRLTITPLAADEIEQEVSVNLRPNWLSPSVAMPPLPPQPVTLHPEYWRTPARWDQQTSWPWPDFQANCL